MKRKFTFLLMALLALTSFRSWGQTTEVQIGNGTEQSNIYPFTSLYNYSYSEILYTATEILNAGGGAGSINSISFYALSESNSNTYSFNIYMRSVTRNSYTGAESDWETVSAEDVVGSGSVTSGESGWLTFNLTTPFQWDGTSNLLIALDNNSGVWGGKFFYRFGDDGNPYYAHVVYTDHFDIDPYDVPTSNLDWSCYHSTDKFRPNIKLTIEPSASCPAPTGLTASNITGSGATITWSGSADSYKVVYGPAEGFNPDDITPVVVSETTYTINNLTTDVTYSVAVKAVCGAEEESDWSQYSFTPTCPTIAYLYSEGETAATVTLYWGVNGSTDSYTLAYGDSESFDIDNPNTYEIVDGITTTTYQLQDLTTGTYKYAVKASCGGSEYGDWSNTMTFTLSCPAPSLNSYDIDFTLTTATISWNSNKDFIENYTLVYGLAETFDLENPSTYASVNVVPDEYGYASYTIQNLTTNVSYKCAARSSCDGSTQSAWSNVVTFTPSLKAPNNLTVSNIMATSATASWEASEGAANYTVAYGLASAFNLNDPTTYQTTEPTSATSVEITGLTAEQNYACAVKASVGDINSQWSNPAYFMPTAKQTLVANNGTSTSTDSFDGTPFNGYQVANTNVQGQFIIPASELTAMNGCSIVELEFYRGNSYYYTFCGNWNIYLKEVDNTAVPYYFYDTDNDPDMELVYSGSIELLANADLSITLDTQFEYNGRNLLVCFKEISTAGASNQWTPWYGVYTSEYTSIGHENNNGNVVQNQFLPKTTITYIPGATRYNVVCNNEIVGGFISAHPVKASAGTMVTLSATPNLGYEFEAWVENDDDVEISNNQFIMPEHDVTISATFRELQKYTITCATLDEGTIHAEYDGVTISEAPAGTEITLVAEANTGYSFDHFIVNGAPIVGNTFVMPEGNVTVNAEFKQICNLTVCDGSATNQYIPVYGFYVDVQSSYLETQFILPKDILEEMIGGSINSLTFYANYSKDFGNASWDIFMQETNSSTLSDIVSYSGTPVYSGHLAIVSNQLVITLDNAYTYGGNNLLITFHKTSKGSCSTSNNDKFYGISATNGSSGYKNGSYFYKQPFLPKTTFSYTPAVKYNINYDNGITGGNITASPNPAAAGTTVTLSATPAFGYEFGAWVENDEDVTIENNQFIMPEHDVTISATFNELTQYAITCATLAEGAIHAEYNGVTISKAPAGTEITLVAVPNTGYILDQFVVNGAPIVGNTYTMPDSEITISATFIPALTVYDNGGDEAQQRWPFYANYGNQFTKSNMIMPAADLTDMAGGTINSMKFYVQSFSTDPFYLCYSTWQVYLKEVSENETTGPVDVTTATKVFEGVIDFKVSEITINFTEPFEYDGGNLLIATQNIDKTGWNPVNFYGEENSYGYVCSGVNNNNSSLDDITSWMVTSKFLPKTTFFYTPGETRYNITVNQTEGGTISADMDKASAGTEVTLSHEADVFHTFGAWVEEYDDVTIVNDKFTMPEHDVTISATFNELTQYTINITPNEAATIHATYNDETISKAPEGLVIDLSYDDLQPGYTFDSWKVVYNGKIDVEVIDNQFTMPEHDVTVSAVFSELTAHTVTIVAVDGGTISVSANGEPISTGEAVYPGATLTFGNTPAKNSYNNDLSKFNHYVVTEEGQQAQDLGTGVNTYTMPNCNLTVSAVFDPLYFPTLNVTGYYANVALYAGMDNMNIRQVGGQYYPGVAAGEYVFINAEDIEGYRKTITWSDSQGQHETIAYSGDNRPCFVMPADNNVTVSVQYAVIQKYNIALDYNTEGGSITVSQSEQVAGGTLVHIYIATTNLHFSFNASALSVTYNEGLSSVEVTTVSEGSHYQFSMPEGDVTVHAEYTEDENYAVNIVKPEGCDFVVTYQPNGQNTTTGNVYCGYNVYLRNLAISSGYLFDRWNVTYKDSEENDQPVEVTEQYGQTYFVMPQGPVTITADVTKLEEHNVTIVQTMGGTITVNGNSESFQALEGSTITMSYSNLLEGFVFDSWIITTSTNTYQTTNSSFSMLGEDLSVEALFLKESIVNDGSDNNYYIPFHQTGYQWDGSDYNYVMTRSQFIIPATDLENVYDASITDMTFYTNNNAYAFDATWKVYVKEVEYTQFEETYQYEDVTNMTQVYNGTMTIENNKMKVHFDTPYQYNDGNLMISFVQQTTNTAEPWTYWYGVNSTNYSDRLSFCGYGSINFYSNFLPKTKFSYKPSETPTERYEITVNEVEGTTLSASRNLAAAGTVITLTEETSNEYIFNGWDVTSELGDVTVDENNQFTMPAANVTVSANVTPKQHYFVTLDEDMTNGTLTLSPESEIGYMEGVTVSISTNPETGYKFDEDYGVKAWKADDPTTEVEVTDYSGYNITMPEYNIVISARFIPLTGYTITYHVNGVETQETVYENERINPSDPIVAGTSFVGWATSDIATYSETEPTLFETGDYPTSDVELYAVFRYADQSKWAPVYDESSLSTDGSDRVIFAYYLSGNPTIMTYYDNWHFESTVGEMNDNAEIVNIPTNTTIFRPEKANDTWKFYFDYNGSETTLADYGGNNLYPLSYYSDGNETDTWNISFGFVYDNNDYIGLRNNNTFNIFDSNQARLYKEVKPEVTLDAYFTEVLSISGDEILNEDKVVRNLLINEGASYTVNGAKLTVLGFTKNVENIAENFVVTDGGQLEHYTDGVIATFQKDIKGYNSEESIGDGWYFIANPTANPTVNLSGGNSYDLYTFNPAAAAEWQNEQYENNVQIPENEIAISRETGYLYANSADFTLKFAGELIPSGEDQTIDLVYYEGVESGREFPGFNLIGNPFSCTAYISGDFEIFKLVDGSDVEISTDYTVAPCEAFFVEATADNKEVTLSTTAPEGKSRIMPIVVNSDRGETLDRAILHLEGTRNSHKFMMNPDRTNISFAKNGERFASVSRGDETEIPMNFTADHKGSYTISFNTENFEEEYLHLIDVVSGDNIDLLVTPSYTFEADADEYASRFRIVFGTTDINDDPATSSEPFVYISNGNLVINNVEGTASMQIVDMLGRIVRTETVCGSYNKPHNLKAGAYVITLDGRAQRIVIE